MKKKTVIYLLVASTFLLACNENKKPKEKEVEKTEVKSVKKNTISPLCAESNNENVLRLEVKCKNCEVKYSLMKDEGTDKGKEKVQGVWCKELEASPSDFVGLFATKLENGNPIEFTLKSIKFTEGVDADTVEVRAYYNNKLLKQSLGNGYAGISMLEIPQTKKAKPLDLSECIGQNIFDIIMKYSKSSPETLSGTDNEYWIVYYKDIDVTFKVKKKNDKIEFAEKGKK